MYNILIVFILCCEITSAAINMGTFRDSFGGISTFKGGLRCKGWVNSVIINYRN